MPFGSRQSGIATARRIRRDRVVALRLGEVGAQADLDQRAVLRREEVGEARLRRPRGRLGSNTIRETKLGSLSCGVDVIPYFSASCSVVRTNWASTSCLACSPSFLASFSLRPSERASARAAVAARSACAALAALCAWNWSWIWPTASLRNVPGPNTTLTGFVRASRAHGPFAAAARRLALRHVAREAALEAEHAEQVRGERRLGERLADEDVHGVVAEALVQALGGGEAGRAAADEGVRRGARLEPRERERAARDGEQPDDQ